MTIEQLAQGAHEALTPYFKPRSFGKGQLLWSEGDTDGLLVSLKSGRVKVYRLLPTGKAVTLFVFGAGSVFGFMPFFDDAPYPAYAQALEDCQADVISRSGLNEAVRADPGLAIVLLKHLAKRLRDAFATIERLQSRGTDPKVAAAFLALVESTSNSVHDLIVVSLPIPSNEFAQSLGLTPESFSRSVTHLVEKCVLKRLKRNRFQVLDLKTLGTIAGSAVW